MHGDDAAGLGQYAKRRPCQSESPGQPMHGPRASLCMVPGPAYARSRSQPMHAPYTVAERRGGDFERSGLQGRHVFGQDLAVIWAVGRPTRERR